MAVEKLSTVVIDATAPHTATVIWLHGLGDSGIGWVFLTEELGPKFPHIKWILPNAPLKAMSAFGSGARVNAWFTINSFEKSAHLEKIDEDGMMNSVAAVDQLIREEIKMGTPCERIILGGFSQGCVISLLSAVSTSHKLAGVVACSGWLALGEKLETFGSEMNKQIPILMCHGTEDLVVSYRFGRATAKYLKKKDYNIEFITYPELEHATEPQEISDIANFIQIQLPFVFSGKL
ncbi:Phospholipase/carboxylesterase/thioesterase [Helicostylum pulchrum]|uniref:Acyl-protein thioesterase 1 n=1 Tax=Helicostylum pulchrum TaxID=562976 RepID=A0ABP9XNL1_9FUNG|nr:Phospholipase/carboxylesterase/thioesterase [Helicostylum pulchrum]